MEFDLDNEHPLAVAVKQIQTGEEVWIVLETPGQPSYFRAVLTKWELGKLGSDKTHIEFESWEEYMERKARMAGL
jgi:hypothetical protein